jgi:hypothetical protein
MANVLEFDLSQLVVAGRVGVDLVLVTFVRSAECEEGEGAEDGHGEDETAGIQGGGHWWQSSVRADPYQNPLSDRTTARPQTAHVYRS